MKPEKVDYYLNKRKEREAESQKHGEDGGEAVEAEQAPNRCDHLQKFEGKERIAKMDSSWPKCGNTLKHDQPFPKFPLQQLRTLQIVMASYFRSPASEENTRQRGRRSRESREARSR